MAATEAAVRDVQACAMGFARIEVRDADGHLPESPIPDWATDIFDRFFGALSELSSITSASLYALYKLSDESAYRTRPGDIPSRIETFTDVGANPAFPESAADTALSVRKQHGEPIYAQALILGWSHLEVLVEDLAVGAVVADESLLRGEAIAKMDRRARCSQGADLAERASRAINGLEKDASSHGVPWRFEAVLEAVGLGGKPPPEVEQLLTEMMNVRHVLLHRGGRADRRLLEQCPWLDLEVGDRVEVDDRKYVSHQRALSVYGVSLQGRFG